MFSHMAVMYANALYRRGLVREGYTILDRIYRHCQDFAVSRIYPGIPEYFDAKGRGAYPFLTGAASWLVLTLLNESFGVRGVRGDLALEPKLVQEQFDASGTTSVETVFAGRKLEIVYRNSAHLDYGAYRIASIEIDGQACAFERRGPAAVLPRAIVSALDEHERHCIEITLSA